MIMAGSSARLQRIQEYRIMVRRIKNSLWLRRIVRALLPSLVVIPANSSEVTQTAVAQRLVRSYSRSNLNLQRGRYVTAEQLEDRKHQLAKHSF